MTAKQEMLEYIQQLTPAQADRILSRRPLLERCLTMTEGQAIYTDTFTGKLFGGRQMKEEYTKAILHRRFRQDNSDCCGHIAAVDRR